MKPKLFSILLTFLLCSIVFLPISIAQDDTTTGLPEGATKRLGKGSINEIAYSPDGTRLAVASSIGILMYDAHTGEELNLFTEHTDLVTSVSFSADGQTLVSGSWDKTVRLWDVRTGSLLRTLTGHTEDVNSVSFSSDGQTLASGSWGPNGPIRLWDVSTGETLRTLKGHRGSIYSVSFSPDGQTLASGSSDETVRLWDVRTGSLLRTLTGHTNFVYSVSFSPDGQTLASGSHTEIHLWDVSTGETLRTLTGHRSSIYGVSFSPDGQTLASGSLDKTVRLWNVRTGETLRTLTGHTNFVFSVSFSPDGQTLASGGRNEVLLWALTSASTPEPERLAEDVNGDGTVNIQDLVSVAANLGQSGSNPADVNGDSVVNIQDLVQVAGQLGADAAAPSAWSRGGEAALTRTQVQQWLAEARQLHLTDPTSQRGIGFLEQLLLALTPKETALLPNYPNPFNPETWIPYQLATPADVTLHIHAVGGSLVRMLSLGHKPVGIYQTRSRAAYWDGRNQIGEPVASGVYFYTLTAGDFNATRKMLIRK